MRTDEQGGAVAEGWDAAAYSAGEHLQGTDAADPKIRSGAYAVQSSQRPAHGVASTERRQASRMEWEVGVVANRAEGGSRGESGW